MSDIRVCVPVKPDVYKFLVSQFGEEYRVNTRQLLGILVFHIFKKQTKTGHVPKANIDKFYTEKYNLLFSSWHWFNLSPKEINPESVQQFNCAVEQLMNFIFIQNTFSLTRERLKNNKAAIELFMDENNIDEEDKSSDAFKKQLFRFKKSNKKLKLASFS